MELSVFFLTLTVLILAVSNVFTVLNVKNLTQQVISLRAQVTNQTTAIIGETRIIKQRINNVQTCIPKPSALTEMLVKKLKAEVEADKPKTFGAIFVEEQKKYDEALAAKRKEEGAEGLWTPVNTLPTPKEVYATNQRYILNAPTPKDVAKKPESISVVSEHEQKLAEANEIIKTHAEEEKIRLAKKLKTQGRKLQEKAKKLEEEDSDLGQD